jgi:hypothetical protein
MLLVDSPISPTQPATKTIEIKRAMKHARAPPGVAGIPRQYREPREIRQAAGVRPA